MIQAARRRLARVRRLEIRHRFRQTGGEHGFTLVELLVVLVIIAILLTIAITTNIAMRRKASDTAAQALLYQMLPAMETYLTENGTYGGMTPEILRGYDQAIDASKFTFGTLTDNTYCVQVMYQAETWRKNGPGQAPEELPCP
jgi:prepilin-type N-terminal cleavage/methylation domain-containing protein